MGIFHLFSVLFVSAFLCVFPSVWIARIACFGGSVAFLVLFLCFMNQDDWGSFSYDFIENINFVLEMDFFGCLFGLMVSVLFVCASWYTIFYMKLSNMKHQNRFLMFYTLSVWATIGIAFSGNLITMFVFYEMLTLFTYPLIVHSLSDNAKTAGRVYMGHLMGASVLILLPALILVGYSSEAFVPTLGFSAFEDLELDLWVRVLIFIMITYGLAKCALFPLHSWLPSAMVASAPVSALLHAVAVVKSGVFVLIKVYFYLFSTTDLGDCNLIITYLAALGIMVASFMAFFQQSLKGVLAYSTISQLSYMVMSASLLTPFGFRAAFMHMLTHSFAKISLFFVAGLLYVQSKITDISQMRGVGHEFPMVFFLFSISAAAIVGMPLTSVFWSKFAIFAALGEVHGTILIIAIIFSTVLNVGYFFPIIYSAYLRVDDPKYSDPGLGIIFPVIFTVLITVSSFFIPIVLPDLYRSFSVQLYSIYESFAPPQS